MVCSLELAVTQFCFAGIELFLKNKNYTLLTLCHTTE